MEVREDTTAQALARAAAGVPPAWGLGAVVEVGPVVAVVVAVEGGVDRGSGAFASENEIMGAMI
jgi:hypothetical protein